MKLYIRTGTWYADLRAHGRGRVSLGLTARAPKRDAEAAAAGILALPAAPKPIGPTLGEVYDRALRGHFKDHKDRAGVDSRWRLAVEPFFTRDVAVAAITRAKVAEFQDSLVARGDNPKTVNRKMALLSKLLHLACDWEIIDRVPKVKPLKEGPGGRGGKVRWLSHEEEAGVLAYLRGQGHDHMADLVVVLIDTGFRLGEALRLRPCDVQQGRATTWLTKGGKPRTVPLTGRAQAALGRHVLRQGGYFAGLDHDRAGYLWDLARAHLGMASDPGFVIHTLRHTFAVRMLEACRDIKVVSELLGHATVKTTEIYAHLSSERLDAAVSAMECAKKAASTPVLREVPKEATG